MTRLIGNDPTYLNCFSLTKPRIFTGFDSLESFADHVESIPGHIARDTRRDDAWDTSRYYQSFCGSRDMDQALNVARTGWQEGIDKAGEYIDLLSVANATRKRHTRAMAGGAVNVGRMLAGQPDHMVKRARMPGKKNITLYVNGGGLCDIQAETMILRAAMIVALIDMLERQDYSCTIIVVNCNSFIRAKDRAGTQQAVTLKTCGEALNLSDIVFGLGHPSMFRRFTFAVVASCDELKDMWSNQGYSNQVFNDDHEFAPNEFYIPVIRTNISDPIRMLKHVTPNGLPVTINYD